MRAYSVLPLVLLALGAAAAPAHALGGGPGSLTTGHGCAGQCITSAQLHPEARLVGVAVRTGVPVRITVTVIERRGPGQGDLTVATETSPPARKAFNTVLRNLEPDRLYDFAVRATDAQGRSDVRRTTFRTPGVQTLGDSGPQGLTTAPSCSTQCVSKAGISPGGFGATLGIKTTVPTRLFILASRSKPVQTAWGPAFEGGPEAQVHTSALRTAWSGDLTGLEPDSRYHVIVRATDAHGHMSVRRGSFRTAERRAVVTFTHVTVDDDGDKGVNRGELRFVAGIGSSASVFRDEDRISTGSTVTFPRPSTVVLEDAPRHISLAAQGWERDNLGRFCLDASGSGFRTPDSGHKVREDCNKWTWSTARQSLDLDAEPLGGDALPQGYGGGGMHNFVLVQHRGDVRFRVYGHVSVSYV